MAFIVFKGERKLADVLERAYGGGLKAADAKRAEAAIVAANPQLATLRDLKPGAVLVVPTLPGLETAPQREVRDQRSEELDAARVSLEDYRKRLGTRLDAEKEVLATTTELLKSKEVKALSKTFPESAAFVERVTAGAKERTADAETRAAFVKTLARVRADFDELAKKLG